MKRIKIFTIVIISILIVVLAGNIALALKYGDTATLDKNGKLTGVYNSSILGYSDSTHAKNNLYCVKYGVANDGAATYSTIATIKITGDNTIVYKGYSDSSEDIIFEGTNSYSNKMAASVYLDTLGKTQIDNYTGVITYQEGATTRYASAGQIALWMIWDDWREAFGDTTVKSLIEEGSGEYPGAVTAAVRKSYLDVVKNYAKEYTYSATIYYLEASSSSSQNLILVESPTVSKKTEVTVTKNWVDTYNDTEDYYGKRPDELTVALWRVDTSTNEGTKIKSKKITADDSGNWTHTFSNLKYLDDGYTYAISESGIGDYTNTSSDKHTITYTDANGNENEITVVYASGDNKSGYTCTLKNTYTPQKVKYIIVKKWDDDDDREGKRPTSIEVTLIGKLDDGKTVYSKDITLTKSNNWTKTTAELDKLYEGGKSITYSFVEKTIIDGYEMLDKRRIAIVTTPGNVRTYQITITNKYEPTTLEIPVTKVWNDGNDRDRIRPDSIKVKLYKRKQGTEAWTDMNRYFILSYSDDGDDSNDWTATFGTVNPLYKYEDGVLLEYKVVEEGVDGYTSKIEPQYITANSKDGFTITMTNTHEPEKIEIPVKKVWNVGDDVDETKLPSIRVRLYYKEQGEDDDAWVAIRYLVLKNDNNWSGTFGTENPLYKYKNGVLLEYKVVEEEINEGDLSAYDNPVIKPEVITADDIKEGFTVTVTNSYKPITIPVTKVWDDGDNIDGARPSSIKVKLYKRKQGTEEWTYTDRYFVLSENNNWTATFGTVNKLYAYEDGVLLEYKIVEEEVNKGDLSDYEDPVIEPEIITEEDIDNGVTVTVTNKYKTLKIPITKVWDDDNNREGKRTSSVTVRLYKRKSGTNEEFEYTGRYFVLSANNSWTATFGTKDPLYKYEDGVLLEYKVVEDAISYYNTVVEPESVIADQIGEGFTVTVTNTYNPDDVKIPVTKVWDDGNDRDGIRPDSIKVKLYKRKQGTEAWTDTNRYFILSYSDDGDDSNDWTATFGTVNPLYKYEDGVLLEYKVEEVKSDNLEGYASKIEPEYITADQIVDGFKVTVTNTYEPEKIEIPIEKVWEDANNKDGKRKSITIQLLANGQEVSGKTLTLTSENADKNDSNIWKGTFTDLYKYENGKEIDYTIKEIETSGYTSKSEKIEITGDAKSSFKIRITNTEVIDIPVTKVWDDNSNSANNRPGSITIKLLAKYSANEGYVETGDTLTLSGSGNTWSGTFEDLPKYKGEYEIQYKINEVSVSGYISSTDGYTITNTEVVDIPVTKVWNDDRNSDNNRPGSITIKLLAKYSASADYVETGDTLTLTGSSTANNWTGKFEGLPKYKNGYEIQYKIDENIIQYYDKSISGYIIINTAQTIDIPVTKVWEDENNGAGIRPTSIEVTLYQKNLDGTKTKVTKDAGGNAITNPITLSGDGNEWTYTFGNLPKYKNKTLVEYVIEENNIDKYTVKITGGTSTGYTITNTYIPERTRVKVTKVWDDENNLDEYRTEVEVTLYRQNSDGTITKVTKDASGNTVNPIKLNENNNWTYTFENLYRYENGEEISYTVKEKEIAQYSVTYTKGDFIEATETETSLTQWIITNKHEPEYVGYIEITGTVWNDGAAGKSNDINGVLDASEKGIEGIEVTLKTKDGKDFPGTSSVTTDSNGKYTIKVSYDIDSKVYKLYEDTNNLYNYAKQEIIGKLETAYVEFEYDGMTYTTVATANSGTNTSKAIENETERNSFDKKYATTTVDTKNLTDEEKKITASTQSVITSFNNYLKGNKGKDTTRTVTLKYCNGNGTYTRTNPEGAWNKAITANLPANHQDHTGNCSDKNHGIMRQYDVDVIVIENVNLGLFEREQPEVAIFSDLSEVEVIMNGQSHIYKYNIVTVNNQNESTVKARFQNGRGEGYTYRTAVNPADIIANANNEGELKVYVTYEVKVGNYSSTLPIKINSIVNAYDSDYTVVSVQKGSSNVNYQADTDTNYEKVYKSTDFKEMKLTDLNITVEGGYEASSDDVIKIRYEVGSTAIDNLFDQKATLHNGVEILSYTTLYGEKTLYAEQRTNEGLAESKKRTNYGGTDSTSHPGNANLETRTTTYTGPDGEAYENVEILVSVDSNTGNEINPLEDDTYIAPSFILHKDDDYKILSGNVWEDTDTDNGSGFENERLGDGKNNGEKPVQNVKVELYKVDENGNISNELANLYKKVNGVVTTIPAVTYTDENGYYSFGKNSDNEKYGVETDTYVIKFTYGSGIETKINGEIIDARNYKSTIISAENTEVYNYFKNGTANSEWHLNTAKGYSIAVDSIEQRVSIPDLQYSNFDEKYDISTEYSQLFAMQVEFDADGVSEVKADGKTLKDGSGTLKNELNIFDFGIIERAREDIFVETNVEYMKLTLANGSVLADGDPATGLSNIKAIGLNTKYANGEEAQNGGYKRIIIEMDAEYIQRSQLEVRYVLKVTNNSETDYDYHVDNEYKTEYYYFGTNNENAPKIQSSADYVITYLDADFGDGTWENANDWTKVTTTELKANGLVNQSAIKAIDNGKYIVYATEKFSSLASGESATEYLTVKRLLANQDENVYDTHAEILKIDAKTARTIDGKDRNGTQVSKEYKPGNYIPSTMERTINTNTATEKVGLHEQDDDYVMITLTPGTGVTSYIIPYVIAGLVGLIVIVIGVVFIKKKVLTK